MTPAASDAPVLVMLAGGLAKRYGGCKPLAPVGLHGEAVIDLNASDALDAGFGEIVVVVGPQTGPAIAYHVEEIWPGSVPVTLAEQSVPLGTAHAAMSAHRFVGDRPFALVNADDVYGVPALRDLLEQLRHGHEHALVAYRLADTIVTADPVTRGTCEISPDGHLTGMTERKLVHRHDDGTFTSDDGRSPEQLAPDTPVSVNLWGFQSSVWPVLEAAVRSAHPGVDDDGTLRGEPSSDAEVLLPEVIGAMVAGDTPGGGPTQPVRALPGRGRCIGVTHAEDLPVVRSELAVMVGHGERGERLWRAAG
jgi:hypothetical protein